MPCQVEEWKAYLEDAQAAMGEIEDLDSQPQPEL